MSRRAAARHSVKAIEPFQYVLLGESDAFGSLKLLPHAERSRLTRTRVSSGFSSGKKWPPFLGRPGKKPATLHRSFLSYPLYLSAIHPNRRACHPFRRGRHHEGKQVGDLFRTP